MLKKILTIGAVAFMLAACDDPSSSSEPVAPPGSSQDVAESSSSQAVSSSSEVPAVSSSSVTTVTVTTKDPVLDSLPFDTLDAKQEFYNYKYDEVDPFTPEQRAAEGADGVLGRYINAKKKERPYCSIDEIYDSGKARFSSKVTWTDIKFAFLVREDSLLLAEADDCESPAWGDCGNENTYFQKILVGDEVFYYGNKTAEAGKTWLESRLIRLTDSTITIWIKSNPLYTSVIYVQHVDTVAIIHREGWPMDMFEGDSLVTILGYTDTLYMPEGDSVTMRFNGIDTIFIEKYNLKITDKENTWIFEDQICDKYPPVLDTVPASPEAECRGHEIDYNRAIDCIHRNMNAPEGVYPRLCRPERIVSDSVWCILDSEMPTVSD